MSNLTSTAWWAAAGTRAIKTAAQGLVALLGANVVGVTAYDWPKILGILVAMIIASLATSLAGLPEVDTGTTATATTAAAAAPVVATEGTTASTETAPATTTDKEA